MDKYLYHFFHKWIDIGSNISVHIPKDKNLWPEKWTNTEYKNYSLLESIKLNEVKNSNFFDLLNKRVSQRDKLKNNKICLINLSHILKCAYGEIIDITGRVHRTSPSGGARYSLEIYLIIFKDTEDIRAGFYHYNIKYHTLEPLRFKNFSKEEVKSFNGYEFVHTANGIICITSVFDRSTRKYGSVGYKLILLEAGHVGQNICIAGVEKDVSFCGLGRSNNILIENEIGINSLNESVVYTMAF